MSDPVQSDTAGRKPPQGSAAPVGSAPQYDAGQVVSFDSEQLILVDDSDVEVGHLSKDKCHHGEGILHRAFSLFIFNQQGQLLLQKRSEKKRLWPLYWANSCCSHPRHGESNETAVKRRLYQELGMRAELTFMYKFVYQARYRQIGAEHEFCSVYIGKSADTVKPNSHEIADWRFVDPADLDAELSRDPQSFTPWVIMEWERLRRDHRRQISAL